MARNIAEAPAAPIAARRALPTFTDQLIEPLSRLRGEFDRLFESFPFQLPSPGLGGAFTMTVPAMEMTETKKAYKVTAELPGIASEDVEVGVEDGMLRIAGEKKAARDEDEKGYRLSERSYGSFERMIRLPAAADAAKIKAKCKNGVLTVTIPKDGEAARRTRKITVEQA